MKSPWLPAVLAAAFAGVGITGCSSNNNTTPPGSAPGTNTVGYTYLQNIPIPGVPAAGATAFSFDISFFSPSTNQVYISDRTTDGVDVINAATNQYVLTAGAGLFAGLGTPGAGGAPATNAGPNGNVYIGNNLVMAGDGNSTMKVVNVSSGALVATIPTTNPYTGPALPAVCGGTGTPSTGTGNQRVDEMAYDSKDNIVLAINDAGCPPFGTFFSATAPYSILGSIAFPTASGGVEQPTWDPARDVFIVAIPQSTVSANGEVDTISPTSMTNVSQFMLGTNCEPNGTALGQNEVLMLGCSSGGVNEQIFINATNGTVLNSETTVGGADEVWYDPTANRFFCGCGSNNAKKTPVFAAFDGSGNLLSSTPTSVGAHSITAGDGKVFVPMSAAGTAPVGIGENVFGPSQQ